MFTVASFIALAFASSALAQPSPLTPAPSIEGQPCAITWTPDATGKWTQTNIQLMSGDNENMVALTTITTVDTTSTAPTTFSWTCPDVTLYSAVYWYQFSIAADPTNLLWTTRFAIESPSGTTVPPPNPTQPNGDAIAWGLGELKDLSAAKPPPSYITGETTGGASNSTTPVVSAASNSTVLSMSSTSLAASIATVVVKTSTGASAAVTPATAAAMTSAAATGSTTSGAGLSRSQGSIIVAVVGAVAAGVFTLV
ncbi:hypothetical protein FRB98_005081 [Tulasnella sp. 332]|nr:hypothetical protein FRB98_005081 [Tulasnella sp. 332]